MKLLQKLTFIIKNRRLPDETRPDDISSKSEHAHGHDCCEHEDSSKKGAVCSIDGACCREGEKKDAKACCGEDCECEK